MVADGVSGSDEVKNVTWSRCPDRLNRSVFRQLDVESGWLIWQWAPAHFTAASHPAKAETWYRARIEIGSDSIAKPEVWYRKSDGSNLFNVALQLQTLRPLDALIEKWGKPPAEIIEDWRSQLGSNDTAYFDPPLVDGQCDLPLSHVLAFPDGQLLTLNAIESELAAFTAFDRESPSRILPPVTLPADLENTPRVSETLRFVDILESRSDSPAAQPKESMHDNVLDHQASPTLQPHASGLQLQTATSTHSIPTALPSKHLKPARRQVVIGNHRTILLILVAIAVPAILVVLPFTASKKDNSVTETNNDRVLKSAHLSPTFHDESIIEKAIDSNSVVFDEKPSLVEDTPLNVSPPEGATDGLTEQADHSLRTLLGSLGVNKNENNLEAAVLDSVQDLLMKNNSAKLVEDALSEKENAVSTAGASQSDSPFKDSLASEAMAQGGDSSIDNTDFKPSAEPNSNLQPTLATGNFQASRSITKALEKKSIRVPFVPRDKVSVCRVQLSILDPIHLKPEEPIIVAGRQDVSWNLALEDDTVSLKVYMRSKPARAWYIATAVRVKLATEAEFPLEPTDATFVCTRLHNYLLALDKQRSTLQTVNPDSKNRSKIKDAMKAVDEEIKQTDRNLKTWREIQELSKFFYESAVIKIDFASSEGHLPL